MHVLRGAVGLVCLLLAAFIFSENRRAISVRIVVAGVLLQAILALAFLKLPFVASAIELVARGVGALDEATRTGTSFVFGYLGGAPTPFEATGKGSTLVLAFDVFPLVLVICALASLLFYWGVMQRIVAGVAFVLRRAVGIGGPLGAGAAVNVFMGMVEAPLLIRPYLSTMARGELFALMSCGMAGIAGTVMAVYGRILQPVIPEAFNNVLAAAFISAPAALAVAAIMVPYPPSSGIEAKIVIEDPPRNALEAIARGTSEGIVVLANILAHLIVILALVSLANMALGLLPNIGGAPITLQRMFALVFRPVAFLIGVDIADLDVAARLLSTKTVVNEFVAYVDLAALPQNSMSAHSRLILIYAMCGFANFGSVGIMVGGMCAMAPDRKQDIVGLGLKAMLAGTISSLMGGALAGALN